VDASNFPKRNEPMKIVDVCAFYSPRGGGVRTYVGQKLAVAEKLGHDITILAPGDRHEVFEANPAARIVTIPSPRFLLDRKYWYFQNEAAIHEILDDLAPDFVEASSPWRSPLMVASWRPEIPKALIMHSDPFSAYFYRWLAPVLTPEAVDRRLDRFWQHLRRLGSLFDTVVCASQDFAGRLTAGGVDKVVNVPMGVEPGHFSPGRRDDALRSTLLDQCGLGPDATLLVSAGRLGPEKRLPMLVDVVTTAGQRRPIGLVILGEGWERDNIVRAIAGNPHVRLFRPETDRNRFATILASADALLHGCEAETFCMVAAEARASGIPVIVPDRGGAADFGRDAGGIVYRSADPADLVRAILQFPEEISRFRPAGTVRTMRDHFQDLSAIYESLRGDVRLRAA
jgi:alpha-1,6-mannosyltransferase